MNRAFRLTLTLALIAAGCRKSEEAPAASVPTALPMEAPSSRATEPVPVGRRQAEYGLQEEKSDRRLMVVPAPAGFAPKVKGKRLEVRLVPKERKLKVGTPLWVRLEVQNVGDAVWRYAQTHSLLKWRFAPQNDWKAWKFFAKAPDGRRIELHGRIAASGQDEPTPIDPAAVPELLVRVAAFKRLDVDLAPGETLVSLPRTGSEPDGWAPGEGDRYVEVVNRYEFEEPGVYEVHAEHSCAAYDPDLRDFEPARTFRSAPVRIEVVR